MAGNGAATSENDKLVDKDNLFRKLSMVPEKYLTVPSAFGNQNCPKRRNC